MKKEATMESTSNNDVMNSYYTKYEELRQQTSGDPGYKNKVKTILANKSSANIQESLNHLKNELLMGFTEILKPELNAIFDKFDEDANGVLDPREAKDLIKAFLKSGKELKVKHTIDTKLKCFNTKIPDYIKLIDLTAIPMQKHANVNEIIKEIYKEKYVPWCTNFYSTFFDDILEHLDVFSKSLIEEIDANHDNCIGKEELLNGFTVAFGHLTASGNAAFIQSETKWLNEEFNMKLDQMVKIKLKQKMKIDDIGNADGVNRDCECIVS